jgi:hypothetical protein
MKRSIEFDLVTKIEPNTRFASRAGMFAKSRRIKEQRAVVRTMLEAHFAALPRSVCGAPNRIEVQFARLSPGGNRPDEWENLRAALKAVKDEVAAWIGLDDKEGAGITWLEPVQIQAPPHVYRVRIEINDAAPWPDKTVVIPDFASAGRKAKSDVKRRINAAIKRREKGGM